jgi:hypothetical protein
MFAISHSGAKELFVSLRKTSFARHLIAALAASVLMLAGLITLSGTAQAAGRASAAPETRTSVVIPALSHEVTVSAGSMTAVIVPAAHPSTTVTCTITAFVPFQYSGGPYGGGEEGTGQIQCNLPVYELSITVGLYRQGSLVSYSTTTNYSSNLIGADAYYPLSPAAYSTGAIGTVYWTSGSYSSFPQVNSATVSLA